MKTLDISFNPKILLMVVVLPLMLIYLFLMRNHLNKAL